MSVYMVERDLKGIAMEDLAAAQKAAIATASAHREKGAEVRYMRSAFAPDEGRCLCFFEASDKSAVAAVNDEARLPYSRIVEVLDLQP